MKPQLRITISMIFIVSIAITLSSCGIVTIETSSPGGGSEQPGGVATAMIVVDATAVPTQELDLPQDIPPLQPTIDPSVAVFYNLPQTILLERTGLFASPNRGELVSPVEIPAGATIYVMGRNATSSHIRAVWNTGVGWIPASFTDYNNQREKMNALPVFQREPPACAIPITTQFNLNNQWIVTGGDNLRVAVVVDLFRSQYGEFPSSYLSLKVNDQPVDSSRRKIVEQGQFSLKDVVFSLPDYLQPGDTLGYYLETTSTEPLVFLATIFSVPENCQWDMD